MLKRALIASAVLIIPAIAMSGTATPASAGPNNVKMKVAPKPRIRVVKPKIRVHMDTKRLAKRKKDDGKKSATGAAGAEQAARQKDGVSLDIAGAGPQPEPPTTPSLPARNPDRTGAVDAGRLAEINDAADTWQTIGMLEEMSRYDAFGQEQSPGPGNDNGLPGDTVAGLPGDLPDGSKPFEAEGAPDTAAYFNQGVPQPGTSGNPPEGGGPSPGPTGERPGSGHVDGTTRQDPYDPRGMASDGLPTLVQMTAPDSGYTQTDSTTETEYESVRPTTQTTTVTKDTYTSDDGRTTVVYTERVPDDGATQERTAVRVRFDTDVKTVERFRQNSRGRYVRQGDAQISLLNRKKRSQPLPIDGGSHTSDWSHLCGSIIPSYMCRQHYSATPDEMLGQPDDPGNEGGARGAGAVTRQGREAVTNSGDSSFDTGRGATPHSPSAGSGPVGDPLDGECPNCQDG